MTDLTSTPRGETRRGWLSWGVLSLALRVLGTVIAVVVGLFLVTFAGGQSEQLVLQAIVTGLLLGGVYGLVSLGLTLIFGVLEIVNFAQGTLLTLAMFVAYAMAAYGGVNVYLAILVAIPVLFLLGYGVQTTMLNRLMGRGLENQLLVTLGLSLFIENALLLGFGGQPKSVQAPWQGSLDVFGAVAQVPRVIAFGGALALAAVLTWLLRRTRLGMAIRSVAANAEGASLVGVDVPRVYALTFGLGTACVGAAGALILPFLSLVPTVGEQFTILAFVIVVLGGLGSVVGAVLGGLVVGLVQQVGSLYLPGTGSLLLVFAVFVLVLFVRPQGLFGGRS
ncbi:MAG: branched-chain amino acid ABC transporter permease [Streptosporangiaceae bacterium]